MSGTPAVPFFSAPGAAFGVDLGDCLQRVVDSGWYVLGPSVRDFETVIELARGQGFLPPEIVEMPANNLSLLFNRL